MYVCLNETSNKRNHSQEVLLNDLFLDLNISAKKFLKKNRTV